MIVVIGAGLVGTSLQDYPNVQLFQSSIWDNFTISEQSKILKNTELFINATAIAGTIKCAEAGYNQVIDINVTKSLAYVQQLALYQIPVVLLSTTAVYARTTCPKSLYDKPERLELWSINDPVYPHNLYCASKILMEQTIKNALIVRIPWVFRNNHLPEYTKKWSVVQDTYTSYIDPKRLYTCLSKLINAPKGLYQCHTDIVYLPNILPSLPIRTDIPIGMSAAVPIQESSIFS